MSERSTQGPRPEDPELEAFLSGRSPVSAAYRAARGDVSVPPALDAQVLQQARAAVQPLRSVPPRRAAGWRIPLALAAAMLLSFNVLWLMREERGADAMTSFAPAAMSPQSITTEMSAPAAPPVAEAQDAAVAPVERRSSAQALMSAPRMEAAKAKREHRAAPVAALVARDESAGAVSAPAEPAPSVAPSVSASHDAAPSASERMAAKKSLAGALQAAPPMVGGMAAAGATAEREGDEAIPSDAELIEIRRLLASGEREQARQRLQARVARDPGAPVPADLRSLLGEPAPAP